MMQTRDTLCTPPPQPVDNFTKTQVSGLSHAGPVVA